MDRPRTFYTGLTVLLKSFQSLSFQEDITHMGFAVYSNIDIELPF